MRGPQPPALATWLLTRLACGEKRESLTGDLVEQYHRGRSSAWFWRQTVSVVALDTGVQLWTNKWLAIGVVALGLFLPYAYMDAVRPRVRVLDAWYPLLINWLLKKELDGVRHLVYRLHLMALTSTIMYCALLAAVARIMTTLRPRQRGLVLALFLVSQVAPCMTYLSLAVVDWVRDPGNPIWFFNVLWFSIFTFIGIPAAIMWGGTRHRPITPAGW